ncbi:hypothetical protein BN1095_4060001 [Clostridioides difficile]|uniref:Uncharacterized protein n=1 Tax=Clostridioides difficile TaxID=1496 RepID=A0A069AW30_CLODI|nr:hypothetical protein BN1095_4060001 [Clostridioides difficile]
MQAYAFPLSACDEHDVAAADLGGIRPKCGLRRCWTPTAARR